MSTSTPQTHTFTHPALGPLTGLLTTPPPSSPLRSEVVHFRSIPYASVPARFKQSIPVESLSSTDFTKYGPACPQVGGTQPSWFEAYGGPLVDETNIAFDEFDCLSLSVAVPKSILDSHDGDRKKVPVMVYVHGGGAQDGIGHVDSLHSGAPLASLAMDEGIPVVVVNIGYRLNWFGWMACKDLLHSHKASGGEEDAFNLGLYDQRRAFQWVQKFIGGFGGDGENVTAFGESAGSICLIYHLCGDVPVFRRAVLQSGVPFGYSSLEEKDEAYGGALGEFGVAGESAEERLEGLRKGDAQKLAAAMSGRSSPWVFPYMGAETRHFFPRGLPSNANVYELVRTCPWVEDLVIGDDVFEGHVLMDLFKGSDPAKFIDLLQHIFGQGTVGKLTKEYDMSADMDGNLFWSNLMIFQGDYMFGEPTHTLLDTLAGSEIRDWGGKIRKRKVYRYNFCLTNPFPGSSCFSVPGHHFVEILFLFLTLIHRYPKRRNRFLERQALETARRWIAFGNGREPWDEYVPIGKGGEGKIAVCDDRAGWEVRTREEDERVSKDDLCGERRYRGFELLGEAFRNLEVKGGEGDDDVANRARKALLNAMAYKS